MCKCQEEGKCRNFLRALVSQCGKGYGLECDQILGQKGQRAGLERRAGPVLCGALGASVIP